MGNAGLRRGGRRQRRGEHRRRWGWACLRATGVGAGTAGCEGRHALHDPQPAEVRPTGSVVVRSGTQERGLSGDVPAGLPRLHPSFSRCDDSSINLHKEGAGNPCSPGSSGCSSIGHPYYTCAAAATRNMTQSMTGVDKGESHFVSALQIQPSVGLNGIWHIPSVLNSEYTPLDQRGHPPGAPTTSRTSSPTPTDTGRA